MGSALYDPEDPFAQHRPLDDRAFMVDHFYRKLFKLPDTMQTEAGRAEAQRRANHMRLWLQELGREAGHRLPA